MIEGWLPVVGFEEAYEVSNMGRVRSVDRVVHHSRGVNFRSIKGVTLKPGNNTRGYKQVALCVGEKSRTIPVHKIVALAFLGGSDLTVDHIDGDKTNNRLENLEYVTNRENSLRYYRGKRDLPIGVILTASRKKYRAQTYKNGKNRHIGYYKTAEEAHNAYLNEIKSIEGQKK